MFNMKFFLCVENSTVSVSSDVGVYLYIEQEVTSDDNWSLKGDLNVSQ